MAFRGHVRLSYIGNSSQRSECRSWRILKLCSCSHQQCLNIWVFMSLHKILYLLCPSHVTSLSYPSYRSSPRWPCHTLPPLLKSPIQGMLQSSSRVSRWLWSGCNAMQNMIPGFSTQTTVEKAIWLLLLCHQTTTFLAVSLEEGNLQEFCHCYWGGIDFTVIFTNVPLYWAYLVMVWRSNSSQANSRNTMTVR